MKPKILIVEDEVHIIELLRYNLAKAGFEVIDTGNGEEAMMLIAEQHPDLVLLDWMLPSMSGIEFCRRLRRDPAIRTLPVIMITARGEEADRLRGLDSGADDYIVKPFSLRELMARIEAVLRRSPQRPLDVTTLTDGQVQIDLERRVVTSNGSETPISERDANILRHFAANRARVVERDELLRVVWGLDPRGLETRTVDMQVARLRERIAAAGAACEWITTARGKGYRLGTGVEVKS